MDYIKFVFQKIENITDLSNFNTSGEEFNKSRRFFASLRM